MALVPYPDKDDYDNNLWMLRDDTTARSNDNVLTMNVMMIPVIIIMTPLYIYDEAHYKCNI